MRGADFAGIGRKFSTIVSLSPNHFVIMPSLLDSTAFCISALLVCSLSGCLIWADNQYASGYVSDSIADSDQRRNNPQENPSDMPRVELRFSAADSESAQKEELADILEEGYESIGRSGFYGIHSPWYGAIEKAREIGATMIVLREHFREKEEHSGVAVIPTVSTSYTSGNVSTMTSGGKMAWGTYSGTTTSTSYSAFAYSYTIDLYDQMAIFFRKRADLPVFYGVYIDFPRYSVDADPVEAVQLKIHAVVRGSRAWREGIRRGATVERVNGKVLATRGDVQKFLTSGEQINRVTLKKEATRQNGKAVQ